MFFKIISDEFFLRDAGFINLIFFIFKIFLIALSIEFFEELQLIILLGIILPYCLSPTLIVFTFNKTLSVIPLDELPIRNLQFFMNE